MIKFSNYPIRGVDTSQFNGTVNMTTLKTTGALFNIMRAGYGKSVDTRFKVNWVNCKGVMLRMAYWYLDYYSNWYNSSSSVYGMTDFDWGKQQAQNMWALIKDDNDGKIVWLDIESGGSSYSPAITTVWSRVDKMIDGFLSEMDRLNGKTNGIYCSLGLLNYFDVKYKARPLWVAWYNEYQTIESVIKSVTVTKGWSDPYIWQYASHGDVNADGVSDGLTYGTGIRQLDLNIWLKSADAWNIFSGAQVPPVIVPVVIPTMPVPALSQKDPRWASDKLGTSTYTIGGYGCLVTDVAAICNYFGKVTDPGQLNRDLIRIGGYELGNLLTYDKITQLYPDITVDWPNFLKDTAVSEAGIDAVLESGRPVIAQVDLIPSTTILDQHWVVIIGKDANGYIIADPIDGKIVSFKSRYTKVLRTVVYNGTPQSVELTDAQKLERLWQHHAELH